jgi:hypothetical protein
MPDVPRRIKIAMAPVCSAAPPTSNLRRVS